MGGITLREIDAKQIAYDLTLRTVEVEDVIDTESKFHDIVVGKILEVKNHPNADKLRICMTDIGEEQPVQIVCGGSNLYEGEYVVVSKPGGAQTTESLFFKKPVIMINCSGGQERANYKYFVKNGYGRMFKTTIGFYKYIKLLSEQPSIITRMKKNMSNNNNDKAMHKLYKIAKDILKKDKE